MASAYSTPINYGQTIPTTDLAQYVGGIQHAMQQRFDTNLAKIDELITKVSTVPLKRDKDKRYLGERLQNILSIADANAKLDLTNNLVARQIDSSILSAIDENVKTQMINSQKIDDFQKVVAQRQKDKPELYNDANYQYALDKSGYKDYMEGKTDSLGSLSYIDYYDVNKNLNEKLQDFAKERGFEKVLNHDNSGYVYITEKGKQVSERELSDFFDITLASDPKLKQQLAINSYSNYRGVSDDDVYNSFKEKLDTQVSGIDSSIVSIDAELKNTNKDDKAAINVLNNRKIQLQSEKDNLNSHLDRTKFNRDSALYDSYVNNLKNSYAKTYSYEATTDIKYDFDLLKIENAKSKSEKTTAAGVPSGLPAGSLMQKGVEEVKDDKEDLMANFDRNRTDAWTSFQSEVKSRLINDGKQPTTANIQAYYAAMKKASKDGVSINAQAYDPAILEAYDKLEILNKTAHQLEKTSKEYYGKATNDILSGLFGGKSKDLNVKGLATTMPHTAELLTKYKDASQIPAKDRAIALYEISKNLQDHVLDDEDKRSMDFYMNAIKRDNRLVDKDVAKVNKLSKEQPQFWSSLGTSLWGHARAAGNLLGLGLTAVSAPFRRSESYDKAMGESWGDLTKSLSDIGDANEENSNALSQVFTTDSNLSYIQSGDIKLGKYEGVSQRMKDVKKSVTSRFEEVLLPMRATLEKDYSLVLNPEVKADQPYINAINSAIMAQGATPAKDSFISIEKIEGEDALIKYTGQELLTGDKGQKKMQTSGQNIIRVPISNLPPELVGNLKTSLSSWEFSTKNPVPMNKTWAYTPPKDLDSKYEVINNFLRNYQGSLTPEEVKAFQMGGIPGLSSKEELQKKADTLLPPAFAKDFSDKFLNSEYSIEWERPPGGGWFNGHIMKDGKKVSQVASELDYNSFGYSVATINYISMYLDEQITDYRKRAIQLTNR